MLALVRHGQTDVNVQGRLQGGGTDAPLNDTGIAQAHAAADALRVDGIPWAVVVSSPQQRARRTAELIAGDLGLPLGEEIADLRERDYGALEGVSEDEVERLWPGKSEPTVEKLAHVVERGLRALDEIAAAHPDVDVIAATHGTLIRYTVSELVGRKIPHPDNGTAILLDRIDGAWRVIEESLP